MSRGHDLQRALDRAKDQNAELDEAQRTPQILHEASTIYLDAYRDGMKARNIHKYAVHMRISGMFGSDVLFDNALLLFEEREGDKKQVEDVVWWEVTNHDNMIVDFRKERMDALDNYAINGFLCGVIRRDSLGAYITSTGYANAFGLTQVRLYGYESEYSSNDATDHALRTTHYELGNYEDIAKRVEGLNASKDGVTGEHQTYMTGKSDGEPYNVITNGSEQLVTFIMCGSPYTDIERQIKAHDEFVADKERRERRAFFVRHGKEAAKNLAASYVTTAVASAATRAGLEIVNQIPQYVADQAMDKVTSTFPSTVKLSTKARKGVTLAMTSIFPSTLPYAEEARKSASHYMTKTLRWSAVSSAALYTPPSILASVTSNAVTIGMPFAAWAAKGLFNATRGAIEISECKIDQMIANSSGNLIATVTIYPEVTEHEVEARVELVGQIQRAICMFPLIASTALSTVITSKIDIVNNDGYISRPGKDGVEFDVVFTGLKVGKPRVESGFRKYTATDPSGMHLESTLKIEIMNDRKRRRETSSF